METFDITVIGSGPGGYVAAIRCAQLGYKTAIVEKYPTLGGTCTNVGCIPTKALLDSSEHYHQAIETFDKHGIEVDEVKLNFQQFITRKNEVVTQNTKGLNFLMDKNKITVFEGIAQFKNNSEITVKSPDNKSTEIKSKHFIIATGSKPASLPNIKIDKKRIITSTEALTLSEKPKSLIIIGGGVIGVEMASIYSRIGTKVTIIEYAKELISTMDLELGTSLRKILKKQGIEIQLSKSVYGVENQGDKAVVYYRDENKKEFSLEAEYVLMAVGRRPYTEGLGLENTDIQLDDKGIIKTNENLQTAVPSIYAIGDVVAGPMLAHKAEEEGFFVAEIIDGQKPHIHYNRIPGVVYTWPEVASVGYTEEELVAKGIEYRKGKFPFSASARARAAMEKEGFAKVLSEPKYGEVLGVHIIGPRAADLIAQAVIGLEYEVTDSDMFMISYAHPTYSEVLKEAYMLASGQPAINT
ncbi:dihydrolipoyl dehydrogenase [Chryseobacterium formosus]|uniref:Dihydrolipoyl dehydrogenase n=1 Tax=Chryseobacterium formosus TaxID=1537363 RepID=A0ABT3XV75_9FLAO|nr:dihydrolipoyl dehydrogenase [Chryseobacterium formosus]MCX8525575.1 dihydrolipoyl dehydrogenase [Chryseobacterium formosus]